MIVRTFFYISIPILALLGLVLIHFHISWSIAYWILFTLYLVIGIYDCLCVHTVLRNYPVIGHFRYLFEFIRPEIQQYFVATNLSGRPYNRELRSLIYRRAKNVKNSHPFGTEHDIASPNYELALHSLQPKTFDTDDLRLNIGNAACTRPYHASRLNISGMSFGALSSNAIQALNLGAKIGNFAHNTGEGGLTKYHLKYGGDLTLQIGTGYFSMRNKDGSFSPELFKHHAANDAVKMIEIKLSQGAKPSHGGVLPKEKISDEIATIRGISKRHDCISPATHSTFSNPEGLINFITQLRELSNGLPIGIKFCLGQRTEFMAICKAMLKMKVYPDFITIDGAEGGTGAAPLEFTNRLGTPLNEALAFVHNSLVGLNIRQHIRLIASGKIATGFDMLLKIALGADICNMARPMMFAVGCIQSMRCNENTCPTGIATSNKARAKAVKPLHKGPHVANFHRATLHSFAELAGAIGAATTQSITADTIRFRTDEIHSTSYHDFFQFIEQGGILNGTAPESYLKFWHASSSEHF